MHRSGCAAHPVAFALLLGGALFAAPAALADDALGGLPALHSGALRVCLVRHGQALSNLDPAPDLPPAQLDHLTALGVTQAQAVGRALAGVAVATILTSPASRARETAEGISRALGTGPPTVEPQLRPMELGRGTDGRALTWENRTAQWEAGRDPSPPGGESMEQVADRVSALVRALARSRRGTAVALVAHGETIGAYLGHIQGTPASKRYPPGLVNGSITVVDVAATGAATVLLANHIPATP